MTSFYQYCHCEPRTCVHPKGVFAEARQSIIQNLTDCKDSYINGLPTPPGSKERTSVACILRVLRSFLAMTARHAILAAMKAGEQAPALSTFNAAPLAWYTTTDR